MPADQLAPPAPATPPAARAETCRRFAEDVRDALADVLGTASAPAVEAVALGVRDAYTAPAPPAGSGPGAPLRVHLYGQQVLIGRRTAEGGALCGTCLERRWQGVRSVTLREGLERGTGTREAGPWPYATPFAATAVAALLADTAAAPAGPAGSGSPCPEVCLLDLETMTVRRYPLVPDPECPSCGRPEPDTAEGAALTLRPAPKHRPGAFRVRPLDAYDLAVDAFANPHWGALGPSVICDVASTTTSATVGCFSTRSGEYLRETFWGGHAASFADSLRIGVLEGLERYAGMRARTRAAQLVVSLDDLGPDAVDPRETGLYSEEFHRANPRVRPFTPDREIPWVWGWSLRDARPRPVPEVLAYYHAPGLENRFVQESSNGCASGGSLEEAVYFGLMEVVERDAFLLAWYGRIPLTEIDPASSTRTATRHMVDRLALYGYRARFFDTRITFPVPVVTAVAERFDGGLGRMCFGAGAGLDPESALDSALCEIATDAVNLVGRTRRDEAGLRAMAEDFDKVTSLHDHPLVYGIPRMGDHADFLLRQPKPRPAVDVAALAWPDADGTHVSDDLRTDLLRAVGAVTAAGFDVVVVDQTLPEQRALGLHTVKVLVPGLVPIDFGWARQRARHLPRTRTAPRQAGLRAHDLTAADLNPAPHPFP
ncbi:TOMM precursor leader peptide-binding protein [Streptomyces sp. TRM 70351]|uniref:TOMM precursor leader peptide-binding protein n=1 Tax=Streptomyces sp. TRM 70351 TaxID=3116552 RepID=UPI002E7C38B4|nr:TOMM precursor leader peptide-binding protein [Streptomyces sp. TRM 70351]MEE1926716.1 TOMM precursor leader peptide-binding protein [Streptomyces sp. TRM 70351]